MISFINNYFHLFTKGITSGVVACSCFGTIFLLVKLFPLILEVIGQHGAYALFAVVCLILMIFTHICIPETRLVNKSCTSD